MIVLILIASILMASISVIQFKNEAKEYHQERLDRKEFAIKEHINYVLSTTTYPLTAENLPLVFKDKIHELADIHNVEINIYSLEGKLVKSSKASFSVDKVAPPIPNYVLKLVQSSVDKRYVDIKSINGVKNRSSFSQIKDEKFKPLGILNIPYVEDDGFYESELRQFLIRLSQVYSFMLIVAFALAYFLASYITKPLKTISDKINETSLNQKNEKIVIEANSREINSLINAYNQMVDKLEESASKLAQSEREQAWREMAKQVAHEIKNPLTPMRLTVQSFQRKFDLEDPNLKQKVDDYSKTLIQQIDTMTSVASAFSNFASMPAQQNETLNVVEVVEFSLDIFNEDFIQFKSQKDEIIAVLDRTQLIRIITNLVKNAIQSIPEDQDLKVVLVSVKEKETMVEITVTDNGIGIEEINREKIFEPKFTTKNSGMGLGLGIIKNIIENYKGTITFETELGKGTTFIVSLPKK
ncbi:MAG: HAMP domain-containing sensor histidine kinase [Flavobacterium sp.]|jgi:two-component system nitrogen regulation sensor histidine kinase NtrY|uniref:histidine kinase n=1 Tax=Flavobacterium macrobrachii TaxID=591204 RepID=A0ABS2D151_9FLAO|nr:MULTISPECIES: HAMP domain-containing sensor histidine kinase [Flavobacterium]MBM6500891.1 HAMP domain-containing histidine kinase [Flavobacterium macrobrachii]MCZ8089734.1 HAMP domain-containing sensor histidine kinase [Flavobacterium sp.]MCZ8329731.1 HAMP domain-containing sensor histidine kinase [Flavobacterium sp.]PZO29321.1 MAG: two-component sensor histidine kinase [Flavobacteriaceae bacterium]